MEGNSTKNKEKSLNAADYFCNLFNIKRPWEVEDENHVKEVNDSDS